VAKSAESPTFTEALTQLDAIVAQLRNNPNLPLEVALAEFERGVQLVQICQTTLKQANGKLEALTADLTSTQPFDAV
jgi:exodeoxyribonuclease VII small subunit